MFGRLLGAVEDEGGGYVDEAMSRFNWIDHELSHKEYSPKLRWMAHFEYGKTLLLAKKKDQAIEYLTLAQHDAESLTEKERVETQNVLSPLVRAAPVSEQEQKEVPIAQEPGHHRVFENSYVRVFRVTIESNQSSLLHRHDLDYVYVSLGPADVVNAVVGKPEVHPKLLDGQVGFAKGGFAHIATAVGIPFHNVTIELLHPQSTPHNLCAKVIASEPLGECSDSFNTKTEYSLRPQFDTDEIRVDIVQIGPSVVHTEGARVPSLLVGLGDSRVQAKNKSGEKTLSEGESFWSEDDSETVLQNPSDKPARLFRLRFKETRAPAH